jgi:hypothetical protein
MKTSAGVIAMGKGADVGVGKRTARKRAVGTREHIIAHLAKVSELFDANGMASTQLAAAVGYPGSSVAFAQLLSGMERSGLIEREVRGKRTYRISLGAARDFESGPDAVDVPSEASAVSAVSAVEELNGFDYDELARRLLVQVVRRLAAAEPGLEQTALEQTALERDGPAALRDTVTGLEHELASAWTKHGKLAEENVRLREQLKAAQRSLALARERVRKLPATADLDSNEVVLLQRLLSPGEGLEDVRSLLGLRHGLGLGLRSGSEVDPVCVPAEHAG